MFKYRLNIYVENLNDFLPSSDFSEHYLREIKKTEKSSFFYFGNKDSKIDSFFGICISIFFCVTNRYEDISSSAS